MTRLLSIIFALAVMAACTGKISTNPVADALEQVSLENYDQAQLLCDGALADSAVYNHLSATQLCELASIYVRLDGDNEANDASAARCLSRARSLASDSVAAFISSLPDDLAVRVTILDRVGVYLGIPRDSLVPADDMYYEIAADISNPESIQ